MTPPRTLLLGVDRERWLAAERAGAGEFENGIKAWAFAMDGAYAGMDEVSVAELEEYEIVISNSHYTDGLHFAVQLALATRRPRHTRWVTLIEGGAERYLRPHHLFRELLDCSDLVACINANSVPFLQALTRRPVRLIGIPYPVHAVASLAVPAESRRREAMICPLLSHRWNDYALALQLGLPFFGHENPRPPPSFSGWAAEAYRQRVRPPTRLDSVLRKTLRRTLRSLYRGGMACESWIGGKLPGGPRPPVVPDGDVRALYRDQQVRVESARGYRSFLQRGAAVWLWLNLDERYTWARFVLDAAALGVPVVTTRNTGHGPVLFPETTVSDPFALDEAVEIGTRLLEDRDFYRRVVETATSGIARYDYPSTRRRLLAALDEGRSSSGPDSSESP